MTTNNHFFYALFLFAGLFLFAQCQPNNSAKITTIPMYIDSLKMELNKAADDEKHLELMQAIAWRYQFLDVNVQKKWIDSLISFANQKQIRKDILYTEMVNRSDSDTMDFYLDKAEAWAKENNQTLNPFWYILKIESSADTAVHQMHYHALRKLYEQKNNHDGIFELETKMLTYRYFGRGILTFNRILELKQMAIPLDTNRALIRNALARVYSVEASSRFGEILEKDLHNKIERKKHTMEEFSTCFAPYAKALTYAQQVENWKETVLVNLMFAQFMIRTEGYENKALDYLHIADSIALCCHNFYLTKYYLEKKHSILMKLGRKQEAEAVLVEINAKLKTPPREILIDVTRAKIKENKPKEALKELQAFYSNIKNNTMTTGFEKLLDSRDAVGLMREAYLKMGNYKEADKMHTLIDSFSTRILHQQQTQQVAELNKKYETEKKEAQIVALNAQDNYKTKLLYGLGFGLVLMSLALATIFYQYRRLKNASTVIQTQSNKLTTLMRELHHRVKNNLQIVSSLLNLQSYRLADTDALQALKESKLRVDAMSFIHQRLYQTDDVSNLDIKSYITDLCESLMRAYGYSLDSFDLKIDVPQTNLNVDNAIPIGLILNELVTNSFKYAYKGVANPHLYVSFTNDNEPTLTVRDNGTTFSEAEWRKPSMSFGKQLINSLSKQINAKVEILINNGTEFRIVLPNLSY